MESRTDILIAGAGLAGLSAACRIGRKAAVRIIEREKIPGGLVVTEEIKGFRFDKTGHLLHLRVPEIRRWVTHLLGGNLRLVERSSRIWSHGVFVHYPFQSNTFGLPPPVAMECLMGYLLTRENPPRIKIKSFQDFINVHFGRGFAKHFMIPYNRKIWGVHPREMTAHWCSRFVPIPQLEDVIAGAVGLHDRELGYNARFYYPDHGIGELSSKLAEEASKYVEIEYKKSLDAVNWRTKTALLSTGEKVRYEVLISTLPLRELVRRLIDPPPGVADAATRLRCKPLQYLDVALRCPAGLPYHWCYVPSPKVPFYRVGAYSNFSSHMAPKGKGALYIELASRRPADMRSLLPIVTQFLIEMGWVRRDSDIIFAMPRRIDYAYVVYDHEYEKVTAKLHRFLKGHGIHSTGRYGAWNYSAMEDALVMGRLEAEAAMGGQN